LLGGFGRDRDGQRNLCVAVIHIVVRVAVRNVNGLRCRRDLAHIPENLTQQLHTFFVKRENVNAVLRACRFGRKHSYDFAPIRGLSDDLNRRKISVLQALQFGVIFTLNFRNGCRQWNGIVAFLFICEKNPQRRCKERARDNDDGKHDKKRRTAAQTGKGAYQLLDGLCRGFSQLFRGCGGCSGSPVVALLEHFSLCILCS